MGEVRYHQLTDNGLVEEIQAVAEAVEQRVSRQQVMYAAAATIVASTVSLFLVNTPESLARESCADAVCEVAATVPAPAVSLEPAVIQVQEQPIASVVAKERSIVSGVNPEVD